MPRPLDPGTLSRGGGLTASRSVEASSFVHPTQGLDGLIAHIVDPSRAHMARAVGVEDAGDYFTSDHVEGALQEIAASAGDVSQNGVYQGGTFTSVGLVVTLATPTIVLVNGTERDLSGASLTLIDASTNWLYVDGSTGGLSSTTGATPSITSPENVLLARIVTAAGNVSSSRDARWFIRNLDRKLPCTVRSVGTEGDRNSEASFESLDTAFLYLSTFGGTGELRNYTVVIKGSHTVSSSLVVPVDGVTLQGEDGCVLSTGASMAPMIDLSGRSGIRIRDIRFTADHAASTAVGCPSSGVLTDVVIERCSFVSGGSQWVSGIDFDVAGPQTRVVVRDCSVFASAVGVRLREPLYCRLVDTLITEAGSAGTYGFHLGRVGGAIGTTADSLARGVQVVGFGTGGCVRGVRMRVSECSTVNADIGFQVSTSSEDVTISDSSVLLDTTTGVTGMQLEGTSIRVVGCRVRNPRAGGSYTVEVPIGIDVATGTNSVSILGCQVEGFYNSTTPGGVGIRFAGTSANSLVDGTNVVTADVGIQAVTLTDRLRVVSVTIDAVRVGMSLQRDTVVSGSKVRLSGTVGLTGIELLGDHVQVSGCRVENIRAAGTYGALDVPRGVYVNGVSQVTLTNVDISGCYNSVGSLGSCVGTAGTVNDLVISGGVLSNAWTGVDVGGGINHLITDVTVKDAATLISVAGTGNVISGCTLVASTTIGVTGILAAGSDVVVEGCSITSARVAFAGETPAGITLSAARARVTGCSLTGWRNAGALLGYACTVFAGASDVVFAGNTVSGCWSGFLTDSAAATSNIVISDSVFSDVDVDPIAVADATLVKVLGCSVVDAGTTSGIRITNVTTFEVVGNKVSGNAVMLSGILVEGADVASDRVRRFVISNNTVLSTISDGIRLDGYVQSGVVSGNVIDCFLPASPFDPTSVACIRLVGSGTALAKYVDIVGNTCLRAQNGIVVSGVSVTAVVDAISVVDNVVHHCGVATASSDPGVGIDVFAARHLTVSGNSVYRIGKGISDVDVEGDPAAFATVISYGIRVRNSTKMRVSENTISDLNHVSGSTIGILVDVEDTSAAFNAYDVIVSENNLSTSDILTPMSLGIRVQSGQSAGGSGATTTMTGLAVCDNAIRRTETEAISVLCEGGCTMQQGSISDNVISQCTDASSGHAIRVQVASGGAFADGVLREFQVTGNTVGDAGASAVVVSVESGTTLTAVTVQRNHISNVGGHAIEVTAPTSPASFSYVTVDDNAISGAGDDAIYLSVEDIALQHVSISRNAIFGSNGGAGSVRGIFVETTVNISETSDITGIRLSENQVHTATAAAVVINMQGALHDAVISDNVLRVNSGASPLSITCDPPVIVTTETYVDAVIISGNTLVGGTQVLFATDHGLKIRDWTVSNNVRRSSSSAGMFLSVTDATVDTGDGVYNVTFSGNTFDDITSHGLRIYLGVSSGINDIRSVEVVDNKFSSCGDTGEVVLIRVFGEADGILVKDNSFINCGTADDDTVGNVALVLGSNGGTIDNVVVTGNAWQGCSGCGVLIEDNVGAAVFEVSNVQINNNTFKEQTNDAIRVDLQEFTLAHNVSICDNLINEISGADSDVGIVLLSPTTADIRDVHICRNMLRATGSGAGAVLGAITVLIADDVDDMTIDDNMISNSAGTSGAIVVSVEKLWTNGSISGNTISGSADDGIVVTCEAGSGTCGLLNLRVSGNQVLDVSGHGIYLYGDTATGTPTMEGVAICDNVISDPTSSGIAVELNTNTLLLASSITGNTVRSPTSNGILLSFTGSSTSVQATSITGNAVYNAGASGISVVSLASSGTLRELAISGNTVSTAASYGILVAGTTLGAPSVSLLRVSVDGNTISDFSETGDVGTTYYGGVAIFGDTVQGLSMSNNTIQADDTYAVGIWFLVPTTAHAVAVVGNTVHLNNKANTETLRFDTAASTDQLNLTFVGNAFRASTTGSNRNGSVFAPDRSILVGNAERTTGGAGNLATFGTYFTVNSQVANNQD